MKKVSLVGTLRYLGGVLIVMQGILLALLASFMLDNAYQEQWKEYGKNGNSMTVYLGNVSEDSRDEIEQYLLNEVESNHLFLIRRDSSLADDGSFSGYTFGVYGDVENNEVSFSFYGKNVLDSGMLMTLLQSETKEATLGIDKGSVYSLGEIPSIRFGNQIVFKKLGTLIGESGTIQGEYTLVGADNNERKKFLSDLSRICKTSEENLLKAMSGEEIDNGLKKMILFIFVLAQIMLNTVFFIIIMLRNLDKGGKLALLGWSRSAFCYELFGSFIWYALIAVPVLTVVGVVWSGWTAISISYVRYFFLYAVLNLILILAEIGIAAAIEMSISPLRAIRGRFPKKALYFLGILAYLGVSAGMVFCGLYVDSPMQIISENAKLSESWKEVSDYQILKSISVGNDESSFAGGSKELDQDLFDWYQQIHEEKDVYLVNTTYYDNQLLNYWRTNEIYTAIPKNAFWYFAFSETYVKKLGINVSDEVLQRAEKGTRVYLIPWGMTEEEKNAMKLWLEESSVKGMKEGDIETIFNKKREIEFVEYDYPDEFFTWTASSKEKSTCSMPVIYICTPENMTYFESESLRAVGLDGYIKFENKNAAEKYLDHEFLNKFHLKDNNLVFAEVEKYIDGLQKDLMSTVAWFGLVFLILMIILVGILLALAAIYRVANQQKLNVQKFLGYGFLNMYLKPMILLCVVNATEMAIMFCGGSKFGFIAILIVAVIQLLIFIKYMTKNEISNVRMAFKEE